MKASENLKKIAEELRNESKELEINKLTKCAKYIVGMTAMKLLEEKIKNLKG